MNKVAVGEPAARSPQLVGGTERGCSPQGGQLEILRVRERARGAVAARLLCKQEAVGSKRLRG